MIDTAAAVLCCAAHCSAQLNLSEICYDSAHPIGSERYDCLS